MGTNEDFVLDMYYADWLFEYIRSRTRFYWPDDQRLSYHLKVGFDTTTWYRDGSWNDRDPEDWHEDTGFGAPDFIGSPRLDFIKNRVQQVRLAGVTYSTIGSWYTFEAIEAEDGAAKFDPIRLPVTDQMRGEAKRWARDRGGRVTREKGVEFQERYATVLDGDEASRAAGQLNDVHVTIPDITSEQEAKEVFEEATMMAERAVRQVM
jgi:hypothetical protein